MFDKIQEIECNKLSCAWLKCMEVLTATGIHCNIFIGLKKTLLLF